MITIKKTILRVLLLSALTIILSTGLKAGGDMKLEATNEKSVATLSFIDFDTDGVTLTIEDVDQYIIYYSEFIENTGDFSLNFNFSQLADGEYIITANTAKGIIEEPLLIKDSEVIISEGKIIVEPTFKIIDNSLLLFHNDKTLKSYTINFYDDNCIFYTDIVHKSRIARKYDISLLPKGKYSVSLSAYDNFFTYKFDKD